MICKNCKQRNAKVTVTQVVNGQNLEHHYCEVCATQFYPFSVEFKQEPIKIHQLLSNWFGMPTGQGTEEVEKKITKNEDTCPKCGFTYRRFLKEGKLGCFNCYDAFSDQLPQIFNRLQAGTKHIGKQPKFVNSTNALKRKIEEVRSSLRIAIEEERFEDAAILRDEARALELKLQVGGGEQSGH